MFGIYKGLKMTSVFTVHLRLQRRALPQLGSDWLLTSGVLALGRPFCCPVLERIHTPWLVHAWPPVPATAVRPQTGRPQRCAPSVAYTPADSPADYSVFQLPADGTPVLQMMINFIWCKTFPFRLHYLRTLDQRNAGQIQSNLTVLYFGNGYWIQDYPITLK